MKVMQEHFQLGSRDARSQFRKGFRMKKETSLGFEAQKSNRTPELSGGAIKVGDMFEHFCLIVAPQLLPESHLLTSIKAN